jgi:hypothetical protein
MEVMVCGCWDSPLNYIFQRNFEGTTTSLPNMSQIIKHVLGIDKKKGFGGVLISL